MNTVNALSLKDFIKDTLLDINGAIREAHDLGVPITYRQYSDGTFPSAKQIEFDIAVQINEVQEVGKDRKSKLGISVVNMELGRSKNEKHERETLNRIKFSVDVFLGMENKTNKE